MFPATIKPLWKLLTVCLQPKEIVRLLVENMNNWYLQPKFSTAKKNHTKILNILFLILYIVLYCDVLYEKKWSSFIEN